MRRVVTLLDDDLYAQFVAALGDVPLARGIRRLISEFVAREQDVKETPRGRER